MAQIAVFDLDGVIFKSIDPNPISDEDFWIDYWGNPDLHQVNTEILKIMSSLIASNVQILILTARPADLISPTCISLIRHCKIDPFLIYNVYLHQFHSYSVGYHLLMRREARFDDWIGNGQWKREMIDILIRDHNVLFMVEDYKPSADEIRKSVPVLLYEQLRSNPSGD